jgi:glycosyltransferase involved in cell wall biosynthesis
VRILYVATYIPYPKESGGTSHIRAVTSELRRRGHEVILCARAAPDLDDGPVDGMPVHRFTWRNRDVWISQVGHRWRHGMRISKLAKRFDVDIIYERESSLGSGALAARLQGLPLVAEVNDLWYSPATLDRAARIISVTGGTRTIIPERHHHKTSFIHNAVEARAYENVEPMVLEGLEGRLPICYTGSLLRWHGVQDLVEALPVLLAKVPEATLVVVGEPSTDEGRANLEALEGAAGAAGDPRAVHFTGRLPHTDVPRVLAACELCVAPFNPKGERELELFGFFYSPLKLWEYLAAGKAVVATALPNIGEIVGEDRGVLVPVGDPMALASAMASLLRDERARRTMGMRGREFARNNTWERRVDEYERALKDALAGGS